MAEKKETKVAAPKKTAAPRKCATKKATVAKAVSFNAENVGFRAGDVYQALATAEKALTVAEIAKAANISETEVLVGMGWLFKEGKIKDENDKLILA